MDTIKLIQQIYGERCRLNAPLDKTLLAEADTILPNELFEILKVSDGIDESMEHPKTGKPMLIGKIIYPFSEIKSQTKVYADTFGGDGTVFSSNGAGGYFIIKENGKVYLREYPDEDEELYADDIRGYLKKWNRIISE